MNVPSPIVPSIMPNAPMTRPLATDLPESEPTMQMPSSESMKYSGVENSVRIGLMSGIETVSTIAPNIPPIAEQV